MMMRKMTASGFLKGSQWTAIALLLTGLLFAALALWSYLQLSASDAIHTHRSLDAAMRRAQVQYLIKITREAGHGERSALEQLRSKYDQFENGFADLLSDTTSDNTALAQHANQARTTWKRIDTKVEHILNAQAALLELQPQQMALETLLSNVQNSLKPLITRNVDGMTANLALQIGLQSVRVERIRAAQWKLTNGGAETEQAMKDFTTNRDELIATFDNLAEYAKTRNDANLRSAIEEITRFIATLRTASSDLLQLIQTLQPVIEQLNTLDADALQLDSALEALVTDYRNGGQFVRLAGIPLGSSAVLLFAAFALLSLTLLILFILHAARQREEQSRMQAARDENAILRLLDEMGDLANGDLTVEATVTEEKTGAIADAINYAIEALRSLVTTINDTASRVSKSAQDSRTISQRLAAASGTQALQITQASAAVQSLTIQIDEVARNAGESAEVASRSVEVAGRGAQTVRDTITGMDAIREQIQETAKRIKRLGDSSQEIGKSVELIDDIADQTNILALNAAMQAAMAGDAGRGFAVVADEVQRLAEDSRNATKQIEILVRTIQADTNEAVSSMEDSIAGVVEGANLAENAGEALREIENVSAYIADLTKRIADSAQRQSRQSAEINDTVQAIRAITEENTEGTRRAAESVEELANLSSELQRSVAGFRLP